MAPGLETMQHWQSWLGNSPENSNSQTSNHFKQIPPLLRRRFGTLGKYAACAVLDVLAESKNIPGIYASRHGDTGLTLSLLEDIAREQPVSPAGFSLAVHNAVGGLLSIARKDKSPLTAISAMNGLVLQTLFEAVAQLEVHERVLCVIYDIPLPSLYSPYSASLPFPLAVAFTLSRKQQSAATLTLQANNEVAPVLDGSEEIFEFIKLLSGARKTISLKANATHWLVRLETVDGH
jgi:hypothetical protein